MAKVRFTSALRRFFPALTDIDIQAISVKEALMHVDLHFPGILNYLTEENGQLRKHVNIFLQGELIKDRITLNDPVHAHDELLIFQALSGG